MDAKPLNVFLRSITVIMLFFMLTGVLPGSVLPAHAAPGQTTRVSVDSSGAQANGGSIWPAISSNGRFIAFHSGATNLVTDDTNGVEDIFVRDQQTGQTTLISVDSSGAQADGGSLKPAISSDGRYVAFYSEATNLVTGDTNGLGDIFVHDRQTGATTRVSVDSSGGQASDLADEDSTDISGDGRFVTFSSEASNLVTGDTNGVADVFVHDRQTGQTTRVSVGGGGTQANGGSSSPAISNDGRYVTFSSNATNLVGNDTNGKRDVFVHDRQTGVTTLASVNSSGEQADGGGSSPDISGDGRYVVFMSKSNNMAPGADEYGTLIYVHDRQGGQTTLASVYTEGNILTTGLLDQPTISSNGRYVAFSFYDKGNNNGIMNIWVRDLQNGISVGITYGSDSSFGPALSANGEIVAFWSSASLVSGDTNGASDVFINEVPYGSGHNPAVVSVTPICGQYNFQCPYPTPSNSSFVVIFSEQVTGVTADDFSLTMLDGVSGASITGIRGYGSEYFVDINTGTGDGRLRLNVLDNDSIVDTSLIPLGGAGPGNGDFTRGRTYLIDKTVPVVTSITRADPDPTAAAEVRFTVNFSEVVGLVKMSDFVLSTTGNITGAAVTAISPREDEHIGAATYTVTVSTGTGDGTLRLDLVDNDTIGDWDSPIPLGGVGPDNGNFSSGESYTIIKSAPLIPSVLNSLLVDPNPTSADIVSFNVSFSEPVNGVDISDFFLTTSGGLSGAFVANMSGSGNTYTVLVGTGSGDGSLRLDVLDDDTILNTAGIPLGGPGAGNGSFAAGEAYTIDKTAPLVTGSLRADPNPTTAATVNFTIVFSEPVNGVDMSDFVPFTTGTITGAAVTGISGSGYLYTVSVATGSGDGMLRLDVLDDDSILDGVGNPIAGAGIGNGNFNLGEIYTINRTPVVKYVETLRANGGNDGWVLESDENSEKGGSANSRAANLVLGDDNQDRQVRVILDFPTYYLPDNAVITRALLMIKKEGVSGTDPFTTHQNILVDIHRGAFGFLGPFPYRGLQNSDFQSPSSLDSIGVIQNNPLDSWHWAWLDPASFQFIDLNGFTQFRLRFQVDDNDDMGIDQISFFSGNHGELANRPRLVVEYYVR
jgi:hypothetical protein